ncbi:lipase domain-containing protein [Phthorimaea operculella]|nr:lipase domain-containing protein [Phthorimaea operculella]
MSAAWGWAARAFDANKPTRVIVHGFGSNCDNVWVYEMRSALMAVPLLAVSASNMSAAWGWAARAFDANKPTRVIVHGFGSNCDNVWVYEMRSALMAVEECNVVCVDWEGGATMPNYLRAAANTRLVGKQLALLLLGLAEHIDLRFEDVHLIGFSLGAHVAGFAGSELRNISRITGLDPAGPLFEFQDPRARLDRSDAKFVDVIHSNGETLILGGLGAAQPLGHVDFYPNGGRVQHGCSNLFVGAVSDLVLPWAAASPEGRSLCNHRRAYKFFTDSVSPKCHFPAFPCQDYDTFLEGKCFPCGPDRRCGNMGYYADRSLGRGQLYLLTREEEPFCAHQYHVSVLGGNNPGEKPNYGRVTLTLHGDSGLNESFPMTKREDITNTSVRFTRVLVPHPALGVPLRATVHYAAYSGWLSAGLKAVRVDKILIADSFGKTGWLSAGLKAVRVDKILIADSFGKTSSFCKKGMQLLTEESVDLPLYPGDCQIKEDEEPLNSTGSERDYVISKANATKGPPIDPLDNELPEEAPQRPFLLVDNFEWGDKESTGRAFGVTNTKISPGGGVEIAEPILKPRPRKTPRQRADTDDTSEISEPLLRPTQEPRTTQPPVRKAKNYEISTTPTSSSAPTEMMQVVTGPAASTSTALPPISLKSDGEKIVIVYPSNGRDERKIRSHSFPEELQFEALYRHTAAPNALRVDLPTFTPPQTTTPAPTTSHPIESRYMHVIPLNKREKT